jgi:hypothetical protein
VELHLGARKDLGTGFGPQHELDLRAHALERVP